MLMLGLAGWVVDWLFVRRRLARRGRTQLLYSADGDGLGWYSLCPVVFCPLLISFVFLSPLASRSLLIRKSEASE